MMPLVSISSCTIHVIAHQAVGASAIKAAHSTSAPYLSHLQSTSSLINHGCHTNQFLPRISGYRTHTTRYTLNPFPKHLSRSKQTNTVSLTSGRHGAALAGLYHPSSINFPSYPNFRLSVSTRSTSIPRNRFPRRWA